mgnify:FL=1|tara:strand:+ start:1743 stop:3554 length:1812 start_codon:yes stop_codon:yes gene_type:complete
MSRKNPIGTQNVFIGLDVSGSRAEFAALLNPALGSVGLAVGSGRTPATAIPAFSESIATLARETKSVFAASNKNLLTFEHTFNFDGQNSEPQFKIKVLDLDDNLVSQFLQFGIVADPDSATNDIFKPKITPVWVAYGSDTDPGRWVGPLDGYLTDIQLSYDANLLRSYELTITSVPFTGRRQQKLRGISGYELVTEVQKDAIDKNELQNTIEELFTEYIKANIGPDVQPIILLPNINLYISSMMDKLKETLKSYITEIGTTGVLTGWYPGKNTDKFFEISINREVYRDILGALGFFSGEGSLPLALTDSALYREENWKKVLDQTLNRRQDATYSTMLSKSPSLNFRIDGVGSLGATLEADKWYWQTITVKIVENAENDDPVLFFHKFLRNLDSLISTYKINPGVTYETDYAIKKYWESKGIIASADRPVFIVGDTQLIMNYLYGDIQVYKALKDEIIAAQLSRAAGTAATDETDEALNLTLTLLEEGFAHTDAVALPDKSYFQNIWDVITTDAYLMDMYTLFHSEPKILFKDIEGVGVAGVSDFATKALAKSLEVAIGSIVVEFRGGYMDSNILSFEQDISKYLLANLFRVARTAAEKNFSDR